MIGLVLAMLVTGHGAPVMAPVSTASIDASLPNDGDSGRVERKVQEVLTDADTIDSVSVANGYALVGWSRNGKPYGQALLAETNGWQIIAKGAGQYDVPTMVALGLTNRQAHALVDTIAPLTPDVGYAPLLGAWQCATVAGSSSRQQFALDPTGTWLAFQNSWSNTNGASGTFESHLYWDQKSRHWSTSSMGAQGISFSGRSVGWRNQTLVFEGVQSTPQTSYDVRETLQIATDGSLLNTWETRAGRGYVVTSSSHCVKLTS